MLALSGVGQGIRVDQQDKLTMAGRRSYLYLPVQSDSPSLWLGNPVEPCFCTWSTNESPDVECLQCFGSKFAPGYIRFGWLTVHATPNEIAPERVGGPLPWVYANTELDTSIRPYRVVLSDGALSGTITTTDRAYSNPSTVPAAPTEPGPVDWETSLNVSLRAPTGSTASMEFSIDAGVTWTSIVDVNGVQRPVGTGVIRFRLTMTRTTTSTPSPAFEAFRMRRRRIEGINAQLQQKRRLLAPRQLVDNGYAAGEILVLRTVDDLQSTLDRIAGKRNEAMGDRGWCAPLDFYDTGITANTPDARIREDDGGPHAFYHHVSGILSDRRFAMNQLQYSEEIGGAGGGYFTSQAWTDRLIQRGETGWNVW